MTALHLLARNVIENGERPALIYLDSSQRKCCLTYVQVWLAATKIANALAADVEKIDDSATIGVCVDEGAFLPLAYIAAWLLGKVIVPLDPFDPAARLGEQFEDCNVKVILTKDWGDFKKLDSVVEDFNQKSYDANSSDTRSRKRCSHSWDRASNRGLPSSNDDISVEEK